MFRTSIGALIPYIEAMSLTVRPVTSVDADDLTDLLNAIIRAGGTSALEDEFTAASLDEAYLTGPSVIFCFVAEDPTTGEFLGFQTVGEYPGLAEGWGNIATFTRMQRTKRGVGSRLFYHTRTRAEELGLKGINAEIRADNDGGLAYYSRMGFEDFKVDKSAPLKDGTKVDRVHKRLVLG